MFTKKQLLRMYFPVFFDTSANLLLGIVTSIMLSRLGEHVISAVTMVNTIVNIINVFVGGITTGSVVKVSQCFGARDMERCRETARQAIIASVSLSTICAVLMLIFGENVVQWLFGNADRNILDAGNLYLRFLLLSTPVFALFSTSNGIIYGTGDFKRSMKNSLFINIGHVIVSAFFIYVLNLGVVGAGLSYLLLRAICGIYVYLSLRKGTNFIQMESAITKPDFKVIWSVLRIGIPTATDNFIVNGSSLIVQTYIVALGSIALAANSIVGSMGNFIAIAGNALGSMSVTVMGQCFGARDMKMCRKYMLYMILVGAALTITSASFIFVFADELLGLYNPSPETFALAKKIFMFILAMYSVMWAPAFVPSACLRGCGDVKYSTAISVLSLTVVKLPIVWLLTTQFQLGLMGVWISVAVEWLTRIIFIIPRAVSKKWERYDAV